MSDLPINERIKAVRKALKMNQSEFAKVLGLTQTSLSQLELGKHLPKYPVISNLINRLKVNPDYLFKSSEILFSGDIVITGALEELSSKSNNKSYSIKADTFTGVEDAEEQYPAGSSEFDSKSLLPRQIIPLVSITELLDTKPVSLADIQSGISYVYLPEGFVNDDVHRCIKLDRDVLKPIIHRGDYVVIRLVDKSEWRLVADGSICIVADSQHNLHINRIKNQPKKDGILLFSSDIEEEQSKNTILQYSDIVVFWHVEWYFSSHTDYFSGTNELRVSKIEYELNELTKAFHAFKSKHEK